MKYCSHCGNEMIDEAYVCVKCGCRATNASDTSDIIETVIKVFMIIGCVTYGVALIPLAWCIPMTVSVFRSFREKRPIGIGMKVCTLLFVNIVAGICLLCLDDNK